jgi:hypothetical protein
VNYPIEDLSYDSFQKYFAIMRLRVVTKQNPKDDEYDDHTDKAVT